MHQDILNKSSPPVGMYSPGEKLCKKMVELSPVKMMALPGPDAENICCHLNGLIDPSVNK